MPFPQSNTTVSGSNKSANSLISPIDTLCRGFLGNEVATLMHSIKIYIDDVETLKQTLETSISNLSDDIQAIFNSFSNVEVQLKSAQIATNNKLNTKI